MGSTRLWVWIALVVTLFASGCDRSERVLEDLAVQASSNRTGGAQAMDQAVRAGEVSWSQLVDLAFDRLEQGEPNALLIAGAVLDMTELTLDTQPTGPEFEFKWMRVGTLALLSANAAIEAQDVPLARTLVLAGAARWQTESYWQRFPNHDGVAALVLAASGERDEALRRLGSRALLRGEAEQAYEAIRRMRR